MLTFMFKEKKLLQDARVDLTNPNCAALLQAGLAVSGQVLAPAALFFLAFADIPLLALW